MKLSTTGLVLRAVKVGEADRILTLLTPALGVVSASARGSLRPKNKLFSASNLFCYSEWTLFEAKTMYRVDEASVLEVFFGLHEDVESMALAAYMAEVVQLLSPAGEEAAAMLRLVLNSFYLLSERKMAPALVKAVFEWKALALSGFLPDLSSCAACGRQDGAFLLDVPQGQLLCADCAAARGEAPNLDAAALAAMRHVAEADFDKLFGFAIAGPAARRFARAAEAFALYHFDYRPKSLAFYQSLQPGETEPHGQVPEEPGTG